MHGRLTQELLDSPDELRIIRHDVSWDTYEHLLAENLSNSAPRFAYDRGTLEVARLTAWQESTNRTLATIVNLVTYELRIDVQPLGSATCIWRDQRQGFEPDSSFYGRHSSRIHSDCYIELPGDSPADLIVNVNVVGPSLNKLPIYARFGVPEVWQYDEAADRVNILRLRDGAYRERSESAALVPLTADILTDLVGESRVKPSYVWQRELCSWIREYD